MDLKAIKQIVDLDIDDALKERYIISILASDKKVIPTILKILNDERETKDRLIMDANEVISKATLVMFDENVKFNKNAKMTPEWVTSSIVKFYKEWKNFAGCCFKIDELKKMIESDDDLQN